MSQRRITVALERDPYDVVIGDGCLSGLGEALLQTGVKHGRKVLVVSNPEVAGPYGDKVMKALDEAGFAAICCFWTPGGSKT